MAEKAMSVRVSQNTHKRLAKMAETPTSAANSMIVMATCSYERTITELKGKFSIKQWKFIIERYNGYLPNYELDSSVEVFCLGLEDFHNYERSIDGIADFLSVAKTLTSFQVSVITYFCNRFWYDEKCEYYQNIDVVLDLLT